MKLSAFPLIYNVYEVNIRQYTEEGTIIAFLEHLPRLKEMGTDVLWLMPIFPISNTKRKGTLGSYYAPSSYREVNPDLGGQNDLKTLITEAHSMGMRVILDWMSNHTGWDHDWITRHPEYYHKDDGGHIREPYDESGTPMGWSDVAHLNYHNKELWHAMIDDMQYWIEVYKVDGFRQDMAMLVPVTFWEQAIHTLKKSNPNLIFIAESEEDAHIHQAGFTAHYGWNFHHIINKVARGEAPCSTLAKYISSNENALNHKLLFTSNHDENSWSGSEIFRMGEAYKAMAVLTYALSGVPMIYSGQEEPNPRTILFFEKDLIGFDHYALQSFYASLNGSRRALLQHVRPDEQGNVSIQWHNDGLLYVHQNIDNQGIIYWINLTNQRLEITTQQNILGLNIFSNESCNFDVGSQLALKPWNFIVISYNL